MYTIWKATQLTRAPTRTRVQLAGTVQPMQLTHAQLGRAQLGRAQLWRAQLTPFPPVKGRLAQREQWTQVHWVQLARETAGRA